MNDVNLSKKAKSLKKGIYLHYKNKEYKVLGTVIHSETLDELVLYQAQYGKRLFWVRPLDMFFEKVEVQGKRIPRFRFIRG